MINKKISIKKFPIEVIIFMIILFFIEHCMYLIDIGTVRILGKINIDDFTLVLYLIFFCVVFIKYHRFPRKRYKSKIIIISTFFIALTSSFMGTKVYGQPFMLGFRPQRFFIMTYLLYFPLIRMIYCNRNNVEYVKKVFINFGIIELILYITQYFLISKKIFLYMRVSERFGEIRLPFDSILLVILPFIILNEIINKNNIKRNYIILALNLFFIIFVSKTRMIIAGISIAMAIILFFYNKGSKKVLTIILMIFGIMIGVNTEIGKTYLNSISKEYRLKDSNTLIREEAQKFYISETSKSPILGRGFVNITFNNAVIISKYNKGYYFNDNGLIGFYYLYGIIGVLWIMALFLIILKKSYFLYKKNNYSYLGYSLYTVITSYTLLTCYNQTGAFFIVILLVSLDSERNIL